ncbi:hypothetical protein [Streptomyces sp. NPDC101132]|uniref:hypothetical protein n=1 Tax=Streptomyces sp. NPDC101132 TaxID=3366110 RepID=UPI003804AF8B
MISEPELDGGYEDPRGGSGAAEPEPPPAHGRRPAARWLWALGGAAAASAVWAGGLYVYGSGEPETPVIAYRTPVNLCDEVKAKALTGLMGNLRDRTVRRENEHPAVDRFTCSLMGQETPPTKGWSRSYEAYFTLTLHKKTDPEPEFDADSEDMRWGGVEPATPEQVPGLGENAVMMNGGDYRGPQLRVVDGGAVLVVETATNWNWFSDEPSGEQPKDPLDNTSVQAAMIEDARALLDALRQKEKQD